MQKQRILFIINSLKNTGGSERVATLLANLLCKKYLISLITLDGKKNTAYELNNSVSLISTKENKTIRNIKKIREIIRNKNFDTVIIHNMGRLSIMLSTILIFEKTKILSLEHSPFETRNALIKLISKILYPKFNKIITLTEADKISYESFHSNAYTIPNPNTFDIKDYNYNIESKKILSIGRLSHEKGFDILLEIWNIAHKEIPEWSLDIIGEGPEKEYLEKKIISEDLKNIRIIPPTKNIASHYVNAGIYVMPSRFEGFGMVLLEAQSFSLPMIAFDCPLGPREIIKNNFNGYLIDKFDKQNFAEKLINLCKNKDERIIKSKNSFINSKKFTPSEIIKKWEHLL